MSIIHPNLPNLAQALLSLSGNTQPANLQPAADDTASSVPPPADTLTLSAASQPSDFSAAAAQIERQNRLSALADPAEALAVNQSAAAFISAQPDTALSAQGSPDAASVLAALQGA